MYKDDIRTTGIAFQGAQTRGLNLSAEDAEKRTICRVPESILGKRSFSTPDGKGSIATDTRDRVWKVWSRIIDEVSEDVTKNASGRGLLFPGFLRPVMREARHFVLPRKVDTWNDETFRSVMRPDGPDAFFDLAASMFDNFILPFKVCAVHMPGETIGIICRISDAIKGEVPDWNLDDKGMAGMWWIGVLYPVTKLQSSENHTSTHSVFQCGIIDIPEDALEKVGDKGEMIPFSVSPMVRIDCLHDGRAMVTWATGASNDDDKVNPTHDIGEASGNIFDMMVTVQSYKRFIVQVDPPEHQKKKMKKAKKRPSILPMSQRPVYLSMEPQVIRETLGIPKVEGAAGKRAPHERRAHFRLLRSDRFTFKQGSIVPVKGSWIGPTKGTTNEGREYRVLLDVSSPHVKEK